MRTAFLQDSDLEYHKNADGSVTFILGRDQSTAIMGLADAAKEAFMVKQIADSVDNIVDEWFDLENSKEAADAANAALTTRSQAELEALRITTPTQ